MTVLARRLSLAELGVYGLVSTLAGYLLVLHNSVSVAATQRMAAVEDRSELFGAAILLYLGAGVATGALIVVIGFVMAAAVDLAPALASEARRGAVALALVTAVGPAGDGGPRRHARRRPLHAGGGHGDRRRWPCTRRSCSRWR